MSAVELLGLIGGVLTVASTIGLVLYKAFIKPVDERLSAHIIHSEDRHKTYEAQITRIEVRTEEEMRRLTSKLDLFMERVGLANERTAVAIAHMDATLKAKLHDVT